MRIDTVSNKKKLEELKKIIIQILKHNKVMDFLKLNLKRVEDDKIWNI